MRCSLSDGVDLRATASSKRPDSGARRRSAARAMAWFDERPGFSAAAEPFLQHLRSALERWPAPEPGQPVTVAFSGGLDSTVLLAALARLRLRSPLRAAHVDHGLHADSAEWSAHCAAVAADLGVSFVCVRVDVDRDASVGLEGAARAARYAALAGLMSSGEVLAGDASRDWAAATGGELASPGSRVEASPPGCPSKTSLVGQDCIGDSKDGSRHRSAASGNGWLRLPSASGAILEATATNSILSARRRSPSPPRPPGKPGRSTSIRSSGSLGAGP